MYRTKVFRKYLNKIHPNNTYCVNELMRTLHIAYGTISKAIENGELLSARVPTEWHPKLPFIPHRIIGSDVIAWIEKNFRIVDETVVNPNGQEKEYGIGLKQTELLKSHDLLTESLSKIRKITYPNGEVKEPPSPQPCTKNNILAKIQYKGAEGHKEAIRELIERTIGDCCTVLKTYRADYSSTSWLDKVLNNISDLEVLCHEWTKQNEIVKQYRNEL